MSRTRLTIIRTAKRLFERVGYQGTTFDDVAHLAGMSASTMRNHFENKESLLLETQRTIFRELHARITKQALNQIIRCNALDALDSMWGTIQEMKSTASYLL